MTVLEARGVRRLFGGLLAVDEVSLVVQSGEVAALIGPNGAGKTTLFACLAGSLSLDGGQVLLDDRDLAGVSVAERARRGIGRTFQRIEVFSTMSVHANLLLGAEGRRPGSLVRGLLGVREAARAEDEEQVLTTADSLGLLDVLEQPAGSLSTGQQRRVELGRALCREPSILLLDEPASGLDTVETDELSSILRGLAGSGTGVLLVEHDVRLVLDTADRVYAMAAGRLVAEGSPDEVRDNAEVRRTYLSRTSG